MVACAAATAFVTSARSVYYFIDDPIVLKPSS